MAIFITGITGLLGEALVEENKNKRMLAGVYKSAYDMVNNDHVKYIKADICDYDAFSRAAEQFDIEWVIHTAGIADTDMCENDMYYKTAYDSNINGTRNAIELARKKGARFLYISTNAIFDGENPPYSEESAPCPINRYGAIKLECEKMVKEAFRNGLIVRPILMYGLNNPHERKSFFIRILEQLRSGKRINMVDDVFENPLLSYKCAEAIWKLIDRTAHGTYHIAGKDVLSRFEAAKIIAKVFTLEKSLINPVPSSFFKGIAPRPKNTSYNTVKIEKELGEAPLSFEEGLRILKDRIAKEDNPG